MKILTLLSVCLLIPVSLLAQEWPRWQGAANASEWNAKGVVTEFTEKEPEVMWRVPVALGYSGPSVAEGKVYVMDYVKTSGNIVNRPSARDKLEGKERVRCFDVATGKPLWTHAYERPYFISYAAGPRCTPTVADGKVYAIGAEGNLTCLDAESGDLIWEKDFVKAYKAATPIWGFSAHPLVDGDTVYSIVGGEGSVVVAFDKDSGEEKWRALSATEQGYCPPVMIKQAGVKQLVIWHGQSINGLNPADGSVYWSLPLQPSYGMAIASPRKWGNHLFATGHGHTAALLKLGAEKPEAEIVWRAKPKEALFAANSTPYVMGDHVYGVDLFTSSLICVRLSDGERVWTTASPVVGEDPAPRGAKHGTAFVTRNTDNGLFYLFNERGELVIAELSPEGYQEKGRLPVLEPTNEVFGRPAVWSGPAFVGQTMLVRNDKELVRISLKKTP